MARIQTILATTIAFALSYAASDAEAAKPRPKGANGKPFRLHFDTDAFGYTHVDPDGGTPDDNTDSLGFGIGRLSLVDSGTADTGVTGINGVPVLFTSFPMFGIGFGYAFLNTRAIVGARFAMAVDGYGLGHGSGRDTVFRGQFAPYFQWMFLPDSWVRPYVEARIGLGGGLVTSHTEPNPNVVVNQTVNVLYPFGGPGGGVHLFPVDYFSVDLGLNLQLAGVYSKDHSVTHNPGGDVVVEHGWNNRFFVLNLAAMVGVSVWFGGG
jgi:hypothetical protein